MDDDEDDPVLAELALGWEGCGLRSDAKVLAVLEAVGAIAAAGGAAVVDELFKPKLRTGVAGVAEFDGGDENENEWLPDPLNPPNAPNLGVDDAP